MQSLAEWKFGSCNVGDKKKKKTAGKPRTASAYGRAVKNVMIVSLTDFYIVLSSKIFKAEIKEFEAILCWLEHVKRHGLGHAQVNKHVVYVYHECCGWSK